ncbi:MAG: DUF3592 domain-containing protein [Alphaproteobacteria bacterium]|nr:DUF3592 domain-containing protein [Alphaproteobacteria bacterium]
MFDTVFNGMMAFNQVMMLFAGFILSAIGLALFFNALHWHIHAERVRGEIKGVQKRGGFYNLVYGYMLSDGTTHESVSDVGSNAMPKANTGDPVELLVFPARPDKARRASNTKWFVLFGLAFLAPGAALFYIALTKYKFTVMTPVVMGLLGLMLAAKIVRLFKPGDLRSASALKKAFVERRNAAQGSSAFMTMEEARSGPDGKKTLAQQRKGAKVAAPILLLFGAGAIAFGIYMTQKIERLEKHGLRAPGEVVRLESRRSGSDNSLSYYPIVDFTPDGGGAAVEFKGNMGSNPPSYESGEKVTVLYLDDDPKGSAMIDSGWKNWIIPGILGVFGALMLLIGFSQLRLLTAKTL